MLIKSILTPGRTLAKLELASKKRALETFAEVFAKDMPSMDAGKLFEQLINRERLGSTGIGEGIAIPHCRFDTGGETLCACITLAQAIDFDAADSRPVDIMFAMLVPEDATSNHLQTLAKLAETLQKVDVVNHFRTIDDSEQLFQSVISAVD